MTLEPSSTSNNVEIESPAVRSQRPVALIGDLFRQPLSAIGGFIVMVFLVLAIGGPWLVPYGGNQMIATAAHQSPSSTHWFGTDTLGRDVFSRVVLGARDLLVLAGSGTLLAVLSGTLLGMWSGYSGGWVDEAVMRLFDSLLALPALLLALLLLGVAGPTTSSVLVVIGVVYTPIVARVVRSVVLLVKTRGYVESARLRGESLGWILWREIFPSVLPALSVEAALRFSYSIFLIASLGFLGIGVQPPSPNWGLMVKEARDSVNQAPWALIFPAGAISLLVIGVNLLADGIKRQLLSAGAVEQ